MSKQESVVIKQQPNTQLEIEPKLDRQSRIASEPVKAINYMMTQKQQLNKKKASIEPILKHLQECIEGDDDLQVDAVSVAMYRYCVKTQTYLQSIENQLDIPVVTIPLCPLGK